MKIESYSAAECGIVEVNVNLVIDFVFIVNILLAALKCGISLESTLEDDGLESKHCASWKLYSMFFGNCYFY